MLLGFSFLLRSTIYRHYLLATATTEQLIPTVTLTQYNQPVARWLVSRAIAEYQRCFGPSAALGVAIQRLLS